MKKFLKTYLIKIIYHYFLENIKIGNNKRMENNEKRKDRADESIPINMPKPSAIYLGCKVDSKLKCELLLYCREKNVQCYEAKINNKSYELNFKKIIL